MHTEYLRYFQDQGGSHRDEIRRTVIIGVVSRFGGLGKCWSPAND
jgi:hypothetical protein